MNGGSPVTRAACQSINHWLGYLGAHPEFDRGSRGSNVPPIGYTGCVVLTERGAADVAQLLERQGERDDPESE